MSFQAQSPRTTNNDGSVSKLLMFGLIILAVVASVLMLFLDSEVWLKISVIAALWAAFIGAVLATRYSAALKAERERAQQIEGVHNAELEREKSQFAQRQAAMETDYSKRVQSIRDEQLEQLRAELAQMRRQLAELSGRDLGEEDQRAVRARAERIRELENSAARAGQSHASDDALRRQREAVFGGQDSRGGHAQRPSASAAASSAAAPASAQHRKSSRFSTGSFAAVNWTGQDAQETSQLPLIVDTTAMDDQDQKSASAASATPATPANPAASAQPHNNHERTTPASGEQQRRGQHRKAGHAQAERPQAERAQAERSPYQSSSPSKGTDDTPRRGRRRADEASEGLTVAELMKRFKN